MSEGFIKKAIFIVLIVVLAVVWGRNLYQLIPMGSGEYYRKVDDSNRVKSTTFTQDGKRQIPDIKYGGDPFKPFFTRNTGKSISSVSKIESNEVQIQPKLRYLGLVKNPKSKYAIIEIAGNSTEIIQSGDIINSILIINFDEDSLRYKYEGRLYTSALGK